MAAQRLGDAQTALVAAGKAAPRDAQVYRLLGEVLLRRGDAERAMQRLRARAPVRRDGPRDAPLERAREGLQVDAGDGRDARGRDARSQRTAPLEAPRPPMDSMTDTTTEVHVVQAPPLGRRDDDDDDELTRRPAPIPREVQRRAATAPRAAAPPTTRRAPGRTCSRCRSAATTSRASPRAVPARRASRELRQGRRRPPTPFAPIGAAPPVPPPPPRDPFARDARKPPPPVVAAAR